MINRKIVDHISDINLPYTEHARRYLISEGIDSKTLFVTGSPMREVLEKYFKKIQESDIITRLKLKNNHYIVVSAHREENIDHEAHFISLMNAVNAIAEKYQMPVIYSTHPRSMKYIEARQFKFHPLVQNLKPFGFIEYNNLQKNAYCVLSDSGTLSEEGAILGFTGVLIRTSTERPEVLDKGTLVIGGISQKGIEQAVELAVSMRENHEEVVSAEDYTDTNVSVKVAKIIQSYAQIVNLTTWRK
jgi:UDP-N-acetylglucosamine 2-epimerase (non-hydrolysing)